MKARYVLAASFFLHVSLLLREGIADSGSCSDINFSSMASSEDRFAAKLNLKSESVFQIASVGEVLCMLAVLIVSSGIRNKMGGMVDKRMPRPLLHVSGLVFPFLLTCILVGIRLRHTGIAGCMAGDGQCCKNMYCPSAHKVSIGDMLVWRGRESSYRAVPGCTSDLYTIDNAVSNAKINWQNRSSYCPAPYWFRDVILSQCQQLYNFPDTAACFVYGCSSSNTPVQYYSARLLAANSILFLLLATIAEA